MLTLYVCFYSDRELSYSDKIFSDYRKEKLARQTNPLVRKQSVVSELLLRHALRDCRYRGGGPLPIVTGKYGKPGLEGEAYHFSISHSDHAVLCAVSDEEVGADIQKLTPYRAELAKRCFSEEEQRYVENEADSDHAFSKVWTMKESYCKYTGEGLRLPLASFNVFDPALFPTFLTFDRFGYQISVFSPQKGERPEELIPMDENALCR